MSPADKYLGSYVGRLATSELIFRASMVRFRTQASYWLAQRLLGSYFQLPGRNMCLDSVSSSFAQLLALLSDVLKEVVDYALKFMLD